MNIDSLSRKIKRARKIKGLTQVEVAERVGMGRISYIFLEKGDRYPAYDKMIAIGKLLKMPIKAIA